MSWLLSGLASERGDPTKAVQASTALPDRKTLVVPESFTRSLLAFDISGDGRLSGRRVWAKGNGIEPDGTCLDAGGAIWTSTDKNECVRVTEGG